MRPKNRISGITGVVLGAAGLGCLFVPSIPGWIVAIFLLAPALSFLLGDSDVTFIKDGAE